MESIQIQDLQKPITDLRYQFINLTEPHRRTLWSYCLKITGNALDAEDLVQDTLLRAFAKLGYLGQALNVRAYLFKMATNIWIKQYNKRKLREPDALSNIELEHNETKLSNELGEVMEWLIELLPPKQRATFILSSSFEFSNKEIAELLVTSEGTVKSYLHRARKVIADAVANGKISSKKTVIYDKVDDPVIEKYIKAFNSGDVEGLLFLMDENATTRLLGDWEEYGKEQIKNNSLHFWSLEKIERLARFGFLDDEPVIFGFRKNDEGDTVLREIIKLSHDGNLIQTMDWYYFSVELIKYAAKKLRVPYLVQGYQYQPEPK